MIKISAVNFTGLNELPATRTSINHSEIDKATVEAIKKGSYINGSALNKIYVDIITNPANKDDSTVKGILSTIPSDKLGTKVNGMTWNLRQSAYFKENFKEVSKGTYQKVK